MIKLSSLFGGQTENGSGIEGEQKNVQIEAESGKKIEHEMV